MRVLPLLVAALLSSGTLAGCDSCGNEISQTVVSPSGRLKAVVFNRNCGATTGFNTQVSVVPTPETLPNSGGNTLILDGSVLLQVQWASDSALRLTGVGSTGVFKKTSSVAGVSVSYED